MIKVLFIDTIHPILQQKLESKHLLCECIPDISQKDLLKVIGGFDGLIIRSKKIGKETINSATNLKFIGRAGAGMENIDIEYAESKGIYCFNSPEGSRDAVGEHSLSLLLALSNKIASANTEVKAGNWNRNANWGSEIKGKTIGIIGYGNMGSAFAEKVSGFGAKVIAYDKYKFDYSNQFVKENTLEQVFEMSDIVSLHVPLTEETHYMVNDKFLSKFKKDIVLINTSRGKVVKTSALVNMLKSGKIISAGLDVLEYEKDAFENIDFENLPSDFKYLAEASNVILSPHVAGWTIESYYKLADVLYQKIEKFLKL